MRVILRSVAPMVRDGARHAWIHVAYEGSWKGHPAGPFEFSRECFDQILDNFEKSPNPTPVDYDHSLVWSDKAPAAGWIQRLEIRDDGLWALVELTDTAADHVDAGEYRYSSGVFDFEAIDAVSGEAVGCRMDSLALTNQPFIEGQKPIGATMKLDSMALRALMKVPREALIALLEEAGDEGVELEDIQAAAALADEGAYPMADGDSEDDKPKPMADGDSEDDKPKPMADGESDAEEEEEIALADAEPDARAAAALAALQPLLERTGMDLEGLMAAMAERQDAVVEALTGALTQDSAGELALSSLRSVALERDRLRAELDEIRKREAEEAVDTYVKSGCISLDARGDFVDMYQKNRSMFSRIVASLKPQVPVGEHALAVPQEPDITVDAPEDAEIENLRKMLSRANIPTDRVEKAVKERIAARRGGKI